jgi:hypothetical protein
MQNFPFDPILFVGALLLLWLAVLGFFDADRLFRIYKMDRRWRETYPEMPEDWPNRARRHATFFTIGGLVTLAASWLLITV